MTRYGAVVCGECRVDEQSVRSRAVDQLVEAVRAEARAGGAGDLAGRVCSAAARAFGAQGVTLCAVFVPGMSVPVGVSDAVAARAEELQFSWGEGPCWQAHASGAVVVADLSGASPVGGLADGPRLWPAYASAVQRETGYSGVVAMPVALEAGLSLVFTVFGRVDPADPWWRRADEVTAAVREVLDAASPPALQGGPAWLDSESGLQRGAVWVAEEALMEHDDGLGRESALAALRSFSRSEGATVDAVAVDLVEGRLEAERVLSGR